MERKRGSNIFTQQYERNRLTKLAHDGRTVVSKPEILVEILDYCSYDHYSCMLHMHLVHNATTTISEPLCHATTPITYQKHSRRYRVGYKSAHKHNCLVKEFLQNF